MTQSAEPRIKIGQVFVSSVAFAHREDVLQLSPKTEIGNLPLSVSVEVGVEKDGGKGFVVLRLATKDDERPLYLFRVEMIGLVARDKEETDDGINVHDYLIKSGAFMMYPFMREFVANLTARGRFGAIWIRPLNFKKIADNLQLKIEEGRARENGSDVQEEEGTDD